MTIYLDVLIVMNIFITYFLLLSCDLILHKKGKQIRLIFGALVGGISSLVILFPPLPAVILLLEKLLISFAITMIAFGLRPWKLLLKRTAAFYIISFLYAGFMSALWFFVTPAGMQYRNGVAYFHVSAVVLVLSTVIVYLLLSVAAHFFRRTPKKEEVLSVRLECDGRETVVEAFVDTGNQLRDLMSGLPVAICEISALKGMIPEEISYALEEKQIEKIKNERWKKRVRILPMNAVTGAGTLAGFKPDRVIIEQEHEKQKEVNLLIAVTNRPLSDGDFHMLVGTSLLEFE